MSTELLSDTNRISEKISIVARKRQYSDLDVLFQPHPLNSDIVPLKDLDAIKRSVLNLILTDKGERPFQPNIGGNIRSLLFEPADQFTIALIKSSIKDVLNKFEPRVEVKNIAIQDNSDRNAYFITLTVNIVSIDEEVEINLTLERIR